MREAGTPDSFYAATPIIPYNAILITHVNVDNNGISRAPAPSNNYWSLTGNSGTNPSTNYIGSPDTTVKLKAFNSDNLTLMKDSTMISKNVVFGPRPGSDKDSRILTFSGRGTNGDYQTGSIHLDANGSGQFGGALAFNSTSGSYNFGPRAGGNTLLVLTGGANKQIWSQGGVFEIFNTSTSSGVSIGNNSNQSTGILHRMYGTTAFGNQNNKLLINPRGKTVVGDSTNQSDTIAQFTVKGNIAIQDGTQGDGKILTSNANGVASWQTPAILGIDGVLSLGNVAYNNDLIFRGTSILFENVEGTQTIGSLRPINPGVYSFESPEGAINLSVSGSSIGINSHDTTATKLGVGITTPGTTFHVFGDSRFQGNGTPGLGKVPTGTDANGNWTWQSIGSSNLESVALIGNATSKNLVIGGKTFGYGSDSTKTSISIGELSLLENSGNGNIAIGDYSLRSNTSGSQNVAVGTSALTYNTTSSRSTAIGDQVLSNAIGSLNTGVGATSLFNTTTGSMNTALGYRSLYDNQTGEGNTALGYNTLHFTTSENNNTAIGHNATALAGVSNSTAIGVNAKIGISNAISYGDSVGVKHGFGTAYPLATLHVVGNGSKTAVFMNGNVGIGVNTPSEKLEVNGTIKSTSITITSLPTYADDAAAGAGGLTAGMLYKKSDGTLMVKL